MRRWLSIAIAANLLLAMVGLARVDSDHPADTVRMHGLPQPDLPVDTTLPDPPDTPDTSVTTPRTPTTHHTHVTGPPVTVPVTVPVPGGGVDDVKWSSVPRFAVTKLGLWLVDADKQQGRLLVGDLAPTTTGFSPDGKQAAVAAFDDPPYNGAKPIRLYVVDVASGERRQIAPDVTSPHGPAWSADGQWIAFAGRGQSELWIVHADGTNLHKIAALDGWGGRLAWSPTGHRLAAVLYNDNAVLIADVDAGTEHRFPFTHPYLADWSPQGERLAVSSGRGPTQLMNPATGTLALIDAEGFYPRWNPSSDVIAVTRAGVMGVIPATGGVFRALGPGLPVDWSSDGKSIDYLDRTWTVQVADVASGLSRTIASVDNSEWSLSPTVWVPHTRLVAMIAEPNAGGYMP